MIQLFLKNGIDVDVKDKKGREALYYLKHNYEGGDKEGIENLFLNYIDRKDIPVAKKQKLTPVD